MKKGHFSKACTFEHRKRQDIRGIMEPEETEETHTDNSKNIITGTKHATNRRYYISMTIKITERIHRQHRITCHKNTTGRRIIKRQENITDNRKKQGR